MARRIRSNASHIVLTGSREARAHKAQIMRIGPAIPAHNVILDVARDLYSGSMIDWAYELLWTTQILRMAYDSPRIGGGIDPAIATGVPSWDDAVAEGGMFAYIVGDPQGDPTNTLDGIDADDLQDMIVHAEAVALLTLGVYGD